MFQYERPPFLRGVHFGPGTSCGFDIGWWVNELKEMGMGWIKIVDDAGSMRNFAKACRDAGIMPIIRLWRRFPNPGVLSAKDLEAVEMYEGEGITRWIEGNNEPNLPWEWRDQVVPQPIEQAAAQVAPLFVKDSHAIIERGGYPAIPAMAQSANHGLYSSIRFWRGFFNWLRDNAYDDMDYFLDNGLWLSVHCAVLNHAWVEEDGWHFEHPKNLGQSLLDDDCSLIGYELPRDMIWNRWKKRLPIISTEGGVFHDFRQWDTRYTSWVKNSEDHAEWTWQMYNWFEDEVMGLNGHTPHPNILGMCSWLLSGKKLGHPDHWETEGWYQLGRTLPVVQMLKDRPPRTLSILPGPMDPDPVDPDPVAPDPVAPDPVEPTPPVGDWPRPPDDNGIGIHFGLGDRLLGWVLEQNIVRAKAMNVKWGVIAFAAGEDVMLAAAKQLWQNGIMPVVRKVASIGPPYDFARDARLLIENGIPAYVQIFNEPSDNREWESKKKKRKNYPWGWAGWWAQKAKEVVDAGGLPGLQLLHPSELEVVLGVLPPSDPLWKKVWFCSHNYGLNHPPDFEEDYWGVLGFEVFAKMFQERLGFVPPIICGEGGWLWGASNDNRFPRIDEELHAAYHKEMYECFRLGKLPNGDPLPDYLFAVCPWILSGASDEAWYGFTEKTATIEAVKGIPAFVRDDPEPPPPPPPPPDGYTLKKRLEQAPHGFEDLRLEVEGLSDMARVEQESLEAKRIDESGNPLFGNLRHIILHHLGGPYYGAMELVEWAISEDPNIDHATSPYHFIVEKSGMLRWLAAVKHLIHGAAGANEHGVHIVFEDEATEAQMEAGRFLIASLYEFFGAEGWGSFRLTGLMPHSMVWNGEDWHTACPGQVWPKILWSGEWPKLGEWPDA